jgi:hypothetical protein
MLTANKNTYWNSNGKHQSQAQLLQALLPCSGACVKPRGANRNLEKLRKAINCYYDLYNNGLGNRATQFYQVFGIPSSHYRYGVARLKFDQEMYDAVEMKMNKLVDNAAIEQNIHIK